MAGESSEEPDRTAVAVAVNTEVFCVLEEPRRWSRAWFDNPVDLRVEPCTALGAGESLNIVAIAMRPFNPGKRRAEAGWLAGLDTWPDAILTGGDSRPSTTSARPPLRFARLKGMTDG